VFNQKEYDRKFHKEYYQRPKIKKHKKEYNRIYCQQHRQHVKEYHHNYFQNHKKKANEYGKAWQKEYRANFKYSVLAVYSDGKPKCKCCGETHIEFLTIDHINNNAPEQKRQFKAEGKTYSYLYRWLVANDFPDSFQVLCMNCNFAKGKYGYCPHHYTK
jgi:hypothetical protein